MSSSVMPKSVNPEMSFLGSCLELFNAQWEKTTFDLFPIAIIVTILAAQIAMWGLKPGLHHEVLAPRQGWAFSWLSRLQFFLAAPRLVNEAYAKWGNRPFKLCNNDVLVLPPKYINEIRNIPSSQLNAILALLENSESNFTETNVLAQGELHFHVIRTRLTPILGRLVTLFQDELTYAMPRNFPTCSETEWTAVTPYPALHAVVGSLAARAFVGPALCRNDKWLHHAEGFTNSAFPTIILMRLIPNSLKWLASWFLPTPWITKYHAWRAYNILLPEIERRRNIEVAQEERENFFQMMMEAAATPKEAAPQSIAGRVLSLTLASNHTTTMALTEVLYDLCTHPEYQEILRKEVEDSVRTHRGWNKHTMTSMKRLDSFMRESQRVNPPSLMGFKRKALVPITFSDGYKIPEGSHIEFAIVAIESDAIEHADKFDGERFYRARQEPGQGHKYQFATTDSSHLHFGHGRYACPGRFMAGNVIKTVLGHLLLHYDFRLADEAAGRPKSWKAFEYNFPNPTAQLLFRKRATPWDLTVTDKPDVDLGEKQSGPITR